jgi:Transposase IS116/IS110/IS902 family
VAQFNDLSRSVTAFDLTSTLVVVVEMSKASWLVSSAVPGVERQPLKKLEPDAKTADMLVREILSRKLRDRRAVARYAGLTGSPDESGLKRREKGLPRAGNARVRRGLIQLAWRFLMFQKDSALARWYRTRTVTPKVAGSSPVAPAIEINRLVLPGYFGCNFLAERSCNFCSGFVLNRPRARASSTLRTVATSTGM